jgi:hypothetical protein
MGAHTGSLGAKATSLREHWFKEYMADSNTPGNVDKDGARTPAAR